MSEPDTTVLAAEVRDAMLALLDATRRWWDALGDTTGSGRVIAAERDGLTVLVGSGGVQRDVELLLASRYCRVEKAPPTQRKKGSA